MSRPMSRGRALRILRDRRDFISGRINSAASKGLTPNTRDQSEYLALSWVLQEFYRQRELEQELMAAREETTV